MSSGRPARGIGCAVLVISRITAGVCSRRIDRKTQRLAQNAGGDQARRDRVDADAGLAELHRHASGEMDDGGLGCAVHHRRGIAGAQSGDAAIVDDAARTLLFHVGCGVLHAEHHAAQQGCDRGVEAVDLEAFDAADLRRPAGIVEQAIDAAEFCHRLPDQRTHLVLDRDVGLEEDTVAAELFRQRLALGARRPAMTILAPSPTNISAVRRPMPLVAPVITATLPSSRPMSFSLILGDVGCAIFPA